MEDRLKFTDRVEDIPRIPRKLKKGWYLERTEEIHSHNTFTKTRWRREMERPKLQQKTKIKTTLIFIGSDLNIFKPTKFVTMMKLQANKHTEYKLNSLKSLVITKCTTSFHIESPVFWPPQGMFSVLRAYHSQVRLFPTQNKLIGFPNHDGAC
jgi:hypothetical protein